jgi:hypothetical protein
MADDVKSLDADPLDGAEAGWEEAILPPEGKAFFKAVLQQAAKKPVGRPPNRGLRRRAGKPPSHSLVDEVRKLLETAKLPRLQDSPLWIAPNARLMEIRAELSQLDREIEKIIRDMNDDVLRSRQSAAENEQIEQIIAGGDGMLPYVELSLREALKKAQARRNILRKAAERLEKRVEKVAQEIGRAVTQDLAPLFDECQAIQLEAATEANGIFHLLQEFQWAMERNSVLGAGGMSWATDLIPDGKLAGFASQDDREIRPMEAKR